MNDPLGKFSKETVLSSREWPRTMAPNFPKPLRYPLRGLRIGCLRTRAIAPGPFILGLRHEGHFAYAKGK